jgi:Electron transfer DM13
MKNRPLLIVAAIVAVAGLVAVAWYLFSPLLFDNPVDEAFPFEMPDSATLTGMSAGEMEALEAEFLAAVPGEADLADLSDQERQAVAAKVDAAAAAIMSDKAMADEMPAAETAAEWLVAAQGQFAGADDFHQGAGVATILQQGESQVLRFEDFSVTNGPELHVYLTRQPAPASSADVGDDFVDLGPLKGNQGNQNYDIPPAVDVSQYQGVVIYCVPFHVVFASASLS